LASIPMRGRRAERARPRTADHRRSPVDDDQVGAGDPCWS
jgi:hypothetical protein